MRGVVHCRWELNPASPPSRTAVTMVVDAVVWVRDADSGRHGV
jgi:hypothetical protein